jgi:metallo-beta-lactamase superfamily protein
VVHLGDRRWIVIDSCVDAKSHEPVPLDYLRSLGVDCAKDVTTVLATHWHDDHVRGLADVVEACDSARFICSSAFRTDEFLELTQSNILGAERMTSGVRELRAVLEIVRSRKASGRSNAGPIFALENAIIEQTEHCEVRALSPSSAAIERATAAIASMLPEPLRPHLRVCSPSSNEASIALWLKGSVGAALLGADVERHGTDDRGWGAILALNPAASRRASLVKVPHHGSVSAHDQRMWDEVLVPKPAALLTPWNRGSTRLPTDEDRCRIANLAPDAFIVGQCTAKLERYDPAVERTLKEVAESRHTAIGHMGHARARCGPLDNGVWRIDPIRSARLLSAAA